MRINPLVERGLSAVERGLRVGHLHPAQPDYAPIVMHFLYSFSKIAGLIIGIFPNPVPNYDYNS